MQIDLDIILQRQDYQSRKGIFSSIYEKLSVIFLANRISVHKVLLFCHDILFIPISILVCIYLYQIYYTPVLSGGSSSFYWFILLIFFAYIPFSHVNQLYEYQVVLNKARHTSAILKTLFINAIILIFISFLFKWTTITQNRIFICSSYLFIFSIFFLNRVILIPAIFLYLISTKIINRNMVIVGIDSLSVEKAKMLISSKQSYFNICGFLEVNESLNIEHIKNMPVLGKLQNLKKIVSKFKIHDILICYESKNEEFLHEIIEKCKEANKTIHVVSGLYDVIKKKLEVEEIGRVSSFRVYPVQYSWSYHMVKRAIDIIGSLCILLALFPFFVIIIAIIKIDSAGPIFYKSNRIGLNGNTFLMYKFRSMYINSSSDVHEIKVKRMILENGNTTKLEDDKRITPVGKVLRKLSLDEFPQLINVLKGEMSLIGPRPCLPYEFELMKSWQKKRVSVLPGITGLWQIKGRNEVLFNDQMVLDLYYIENQSILFDIEILIDTIPVVLFGKGGK